MNTIKQEIIRLSKEQVALKNQRKTVNLVGKRTVEPSVAAYRVVNGKETLRHLFAAYAILRGKERLQPMKKELSQRLVDSLVEKYKEEVVVIN